MFLTYFVPIYYPSLRLFQQQFIIQLCPIIISFESHYLTLSHFDVSITLVEVFQKSVSISCFNKLLILRFQNFSSKKLLTFHILMHQDLTNQPIRNAKIIDLVTQWIKSYNHLERHPLYTYKCDLKNILPLPDYFIINTILYAFYAIFPFLIEDLTTNSKIQTSYQLKKFYTQQFYQGKWKKEFVFQFTMVYLTKTISWFIEDYFPNLEINENLESQIFIILFKVLIGTEVGTKIYNVTAKKYVKLLDGKVLKKGDIKTSISQSVHKKSTPFTMDYPMKQSSQYFREQIQRDSFGSSSMHKIPQTFQTPYKSLQKPDQNSVARRLLTKNKISLFRSRMENPQQRSTLQIFNQQLKTNLRVDAFKKVAQMKYDIGDYEEIGLSVKQRQQSEKKRYDPMRQARKQKRQKTNQISSGKISQSMQINLHLHKQHQTTSPTKFYYPFNYNITSGKKLSITRQISFKNSYTLPLQKAHSLCESSTGDVVERKTDKEGGMNARSMMLLPFKNRNKSQTKLTLEEWNQLLKEMKMNVKNADNNPKEHHLVNKKSFLQHKQSNEEQVFQAQQPKTRNLSYQRRTHDPAYKNQTTNVTTMKLKAQLNQSPISRQKSVSRANLKQDEENAFRKIDIFTATSGETFQMPETKEQSAKMKSRTINMGNKGNYLQCERLHKKSKTRIIKLSKIQFQTECKKRQQGLYEVISYSAMAAKGSLS